MTKSLTTKQRAEWLSWLEQDPVNWAELHFAIEDRIDPITGEELGPGPIILADHQKRIIRAALERDAGGRFRWTTIVYSAVKKSGKSRVTALVACWVASKFGPYAEVYCCANDGKQSEDRILSAVKKCLAINNHLGWHETRSQITLPDGSFIEAIPVDPTGEAGSNPTMSAWCFDEDTEILTSEGWKCFATLYDDDEVATLNPEGYFEWQKPHAINRSWYKGDMIGVDVRGFSLLVTPEHRLHGSFYERVQDLCRSEPSHIGFMSAEEATGQYCYRPTLRANGWVGKEPGPILIPATERRPAITLDPLPFAEFLGWFLSEGCISRKRRRPEGVLIGQCKKANPENRRTIKAVIRQLGFHPREWADEMNIVIWDTRLAHYCDKFGGSGEKYVPRWLKNAPRQYLRAFLDAYLAGDGTVKSKSGFTISTTSGEMADDLIEIGQKLGFRTHCSTTSDYRWGPEPHIIYGIGFSCSGMRHRILKKHWKRVPYEGHIYCPSTGNGIVLVRRKGSCYWSGQSELWGYGLQHKQRLWAEMAPSPARMGRSIQWVDTYAGYEGESPVLEQLYDQGVTQGRRYTEKFPDLPVYINEPASLFMYWDHEARMVWQTPEYYAAEEARLPPAQFQRIHRNMWVSSEDTFVPIQWWTACQEKLPPLQDGEKLILGADAAVSGACFGLVGVTRHPDRREDVAVRYARAWTPPKGGKIDFTAKDGPEDEIRRLCEQYKVIELAYDPYQLHRTATEFNQKRIVYARPFGQMGQRLECDSQLYQLIRDRRVAHSGEPELMQHIMNANSKTAKTEDTKMRIVRRTRNKPIDLVIALAMAASRTLYLRL